jgi:hypothetical protein
MEAAVQFNNNQRVASSYQWLVTGIGALVFLAEVRRLPIERIDLQFLMIAVMTVLVSARVAVKIPRFNTSVTISDTFIFLAILIYGGEAAILLAFADGLIIGARAGKKARTILFSAAAMGCSTALTVLVLTLAFGSPLRLAHTALPERVAAICVMALTQYFANTGLVSACMSMRHKQPLWQMWSKNYLWSSITYFGGAIVAGFIASRVDMVALYLVLVAIPTVFIL